MSPRRGLTLIEMVVVILIIGVLAAILLPVLARARARSRRVACLSNLRQIGIALQSYQGANGVFPSANYRDRPARGSANVFSPFSQLLPFLDQGALYDKIDFNVWLISQDPPVGHEPLEIFHCPADVAYSNEGSINYRVNLGPGPYWWDFPPGHPQYNDWPEGGRGAFKIMDFLSESAFQDGLSHTVGVSEKILGDRDDGAFSFRGDYWFPGIYGPPFPKGAELRQMCSQLPRGAIRDGSDGGSRWLEMGWQYTWYNHVAKPNDAEVPDCAVEFEISSHVKPPGGIFSARSYHPGGVNCVMMDASGRFVSDEISLEVWQALGTRDGGEVIEDGQRGPF